MRAVTVIGAGMTRFGKFLDHSLKELAAEAVKGALDSAGIDGSKLQVAVVGNATAGLITGQEMIRGQVVLRELGIGGIPIVNAENACASSSTAFHLAWLYVASGMYDMALALGMEKLYHQDKRKSFQAIGAAVDVEWAQHLQDVSSRNDIASGKEPLPQEGSGEKRSIFMDFLATRACQHMARYGTTKEQFARIAVKNHLHGSLNPLAQYRDVYTLEDVLNSPLIVDPLTRLMCAPIGDGAASVVICAAEKARQFTAKPIFVRASALGSGKDREPGEPTIVERVAREAYEQAGIGPGDLSVVEVHDASAPGELFIYEELGLCAPGEGGKLIDSQVTCLGGRIPVNTSGGLISRGHPLGATGIAQIHEIFTQLQGQAGDRQVKEAGVGLAQNGGGWIKGETAATAVHILSI